MKFLAEEIEAYSLAHTEDESALLKSLNRETHANILNPRMLSGHLQGRFLSMISRMIRPDRILEIGTYTGADDNRHQRRAGNVYAPLFCQFPLCQSD
jgi:caffeoyl-CoA O-methyltransferase